MNINTQDKLKFLRAKHARMVSEMAMFRACADRDTAREGWSSDWMALFSLAREQALEIEAEIQLILDNNK